MSTLVPFVDEGLGNASYLVDLGGRRALVLDPWRDIGPYRRPAVERGLTLAYAVETHLHADFVSGSRELAAEGATIVAPRGAGLGVPHLGLDDGDELDLGGLTLRALATPGHTPEHLAYRLLDGSRPLALFSGGALLPGSVARTDLIAPEQTDPLARSLYRALHERILTLPDDLPVYPTHGGSSFCSLDAGGERSTTIGRERAANPLLATADEDAFVARLLATFGSHPDYFLRLREVNRRGPRVYGEFPDLPSLELAAVDQLRETGAELIDVRQAAEWRAGHVPGARHVELGSLGGPRIEDVPDGATIICGHGERAMSAASLVERAGRVAAVFLGGPDDWAAATGRRMDVGA